MSQPDFANTTIPPAEKNSVRLRRPSSPRPLTAGELAEDTLKSCRHLIERLAALPPNTIAPTHGELVGDADGRQENSGHERAADAGAGLADALNASPAFCAVITVAAQMGQ